MTSVPFQQKARSLVWTLNNFKEEDIISLRKYAIDCKYLIFGKEIAPTTGTPHLQGYVAWANPRSVGKFMEIFVTKGVHIEKARGTAKQASEYCKKEGNFEEFGQLPQQGERIDWEKALTDIKNGSSIGDVIEDQPHLLPNIRALKEYKSTTLKPLHREVNVIVIYGEAGSGKTRYVYENFADIFAKPPEKQSGSYFDGYTGQKTLLLDDFYGGIKYSELLRVLDRYPYAAPITGGYVQAQWDTVLITSNDAPALWYKVGLTPALKRRLNKVIYCRVIDGKTTYSEETRDEAQTDE